MDGFALLDPLTGAEDPLRVGRNMIGRSAALLTDGSSFIFIESARSTISRLQAVIDIDPNGDAWLMDSRSTNGTFLAITPGAGLRLEANRFYQLSRGARITFGDVERHFVAGALGRPTPPAALSATDRPAASEPLSGCSRLSAPYLSPGDSPPRPKRPRSRAATPARAIALCYSGMAAEERTQAQRRAAQCGATVTDSVLEADVLVVSAPVTRTPKFIIAVARGIPVVTEDFVQCADLARAEKYVPSLRHGNHSYSAAALRKVIFRKEKTLPLSGKSFSVSGLPNKSRPVSREIILGCGGEIPRRQSKETVALTEESLDKLYDNLLRGKL